MQLKEIPITIWSTEKTCIKTVISGLTRLNISSVNNLSFSDI